jgi:hypothetical protein
MVNAEGRVCDWHLPFALGSTAEHIRVHRGMVQSAEEALSPWLYESGSIRASSPTERHRVIRIGVSPNLLVRASISYLL